MQTLLTITIAISFIILLRRKNLPKAEAKWVFTVE